MRVTLKVLASTSIKRRKPWSKLAWIGQEHEELFLLGNRRLSILYLKSGHTKRKITKLAHIIKNCITLNYTNNGCYLFGLLSSGELFVWHKDSNVLLKIDGINDLKERSPIGDKCLTKVYASDDVSKIFVSVCRTSSTEVYLWEQQSGVCLFGIGKQHQQEGVFGRWWQVPTEFEMSRLMLPRFCKNVCVDVCFVKDGILGDCCLAAFIYSSCNVVNFVVLNVTWFPNSNIPTYRWNHIALPLLQLSSTASLAPKKGTLVARWSHKGQLLATAINLENSETDKVVFLSSICEVVFVSTLPEEFTGPRYLHRVCDLAWTYDDLFVVTINHLGSICVLSRLGEPLKFATEGCSMDLPAALSLNIHPFIFVSQQKSIDGDSNSITADILKQRFSVSCHPRLPLFLCSDGYMVTCLQFPRDLSDTSKFVNVSVSQVSKDLNILKKLLQLSMETINSVEDSSVLALLRCKSSIRVNEFDASNKIAVSIDSRASCVVTDPLSESDSSQLLSEAILHHYSVFGEHESGTLVFGTQNLDHSSSGPNNYATFQDFIVDVKREAKARLLCVWSVLVTISETWTKEFDVFSKRASHLLVELCDTLLSTNGSCVSEVRCLLPSFVETRFLINSWRNLCRYITTNKTLLLLVLRTGQQVMCKMLKFVLSLPPELKDLHFASLFNLLKSIEKTVVVASSIKSKLPVCVSLLSDGSFTYDTSACCLYPPNPSDSRAVKKRLLPMWRLFYKTISETYASSSEMNGLIDVLGTIQQKLRQLGDCLYATKSRRTIGLAESVILSTPGYCNQAIDIWKEELQKHLNSTDDRSIHRSIRILHCILYALLERYNCKEVISFVYWLLMRDCQNNNVESGSRHIAIQRTMKSFARFISAYFLNQKLFVYTPDHPREFPSPFRPRQCWKHRLVPMLRAKLVKSLEDDSILHHWTPDVAVALFMSAGCVGEAAQLSHHLGDWKSAYVLCYVAKVMMKKSAFGLEEYEMLQSLLSSHLCEVIDSNRALFVSTLSEPLPQLTATLQDWFLAGALCDVDAVSFTLHHLLSELYSLLKRVPLIVPNEVYLPYPPPYCPQLNQQNQTGSLLSAEEAFRKDVSEITLVIIAILRASHCIIPFACYYLSYLHNIFSQMTRAKRVSSKDWPLTSFLTHLKRRLPKRKIEQDSDYGSTRVRLSAYFREFCGICWFLHARDKMNRSLRKFRRQLVQSSKVGPQAKICLSCLRWAMYLIPFAEAAHWGNDVYHLIISVLLEAPLDRRSSHFLARCFPDMSTIPHELDHRIRHLLNVWRGTLIKVPSNRRHQRSIKTLSVIHLEQCKEVKSRLSEIANVFGEFETISFSGTDLQSVKISNWNVRPYELDKFYFSFLGLMFDVTVLKDDIDSEESDRVHIPLLREFKTELLQNLTFPVLELSHSKEKRQRVLHEMFVDAEALQGAKMKMPTCRTSLPKPSLFRSLSENEVKKPGNTQCNLSRKPIRTSTPVKSLVSKLKYQMKSLTIKEAARNNNSNTGEILRKHSSLFSLCDGFDAEETVKRLTIDDKTMYNMVKVFAWLCRWSKRDHFTGSQIKMSHRPQIKINLTLNQLLSTLQLLSRSSNHYEILPAPSSARSSKADSKFSEKLLSATERKDPGPSNVAIVSELHRPNTRNAPFDSYLNDEIHQISASYSESQQACSKHSTLDISSITQDSSFEISNEVVQSACFEPSIGLISTVGSTVTSKWTSTSHNLQTANNMPFDVNSALPPLRVSGISDSSVKIEEPAIVTSWRQSSTCTSAPGVTSKDVACGSASVFVSDMCNAIVQVHEESLLENDTTKKVTKDQKQLLSKQSRSIQCDISVHKSPPPQTVDGVSNSEKVPSFSKRSGLYEGNRHQNNIKRLALMMPENWHLSNEAANNFEKEEANVLEDFSHIRLLRLPAERESLSAGNLIRSSVVTSPETSDSLLQSQVPVLLSLEQEHAFFPHWQQKKTCPKLLTPQEILGIQTRWKMEVHKPGVHTNLEKPSQQSEPVRVPPLLHLSEKSEFENLHSSSEGYVCRRASKIDLCSTDQKPIVLRKKLTSVQSNARPCQPQMESHSCQTIIAVQKDASVSTTSQQTRSVAIATEAARKNLTSSCTNTIPPKESFVPETIKRRSSSPKIIKGEEVASNQITLVQATTQTEVCEEKQKQQRSASTNTDFNLNSDLSKTEAKLLGKNQTNSTFRGCAIPEVPNVENKEAANRTEQNHLERFTATKENDNLQNNVFDMKKMRDTLENLQNEGLLDKLVSSTPDRPAYQIRSFSDVKNNDKKLLEASMNEHQVFQPLDKDQQKDKVLTWIQQQRKKQHKDFLLEREVLRQAERQPFVSSHPSVTNSGLQQANEDRKQRQNNMRLNHFELRKKDVIQMVHEMSDEDRPALPKRNWNDNSAVIIKPSILQTETTRTGLVKNTKWQRGNVDSNVTYVLSPGGLIPVSTTDHSHSVATVDRVHKSLHRKSCSKSLSRKGPPLRNITCLSSPNLVGRSTARSVKPTTYTERLRALQSSKARKTPTYIQQNSEKVDTRSSPTATFSRVIYSSPSRSSSCETLSPWTAPEKIKQLLYDGNDSLNTLSCDEVDNNDQSSTYDTEWKQTMEG